MESSKQQLKEIKVFKRRWLLLLIFIVYSTVNGFQWAEYVIVTNIVSNYYNVSPIAIEWTSTIYTALFFPLIIPVSYVVDKMGLRVTVLFGGLGTALGSIMKLFCDNQNMFWLVMTAYTIFGISQVFNLSTCSKLAAVWFHKDEEAVAFSLALLGVQLGNALGCLITPMVVKNEDSLEETGGNLNLLAWILASIMFPIVFILIFYFPKRPPLPPTTIQRDLLLNNNKEYTLVTVLKSIKYLLSKWYFLLLLFTFSINMGIMYVQATFWNQWIIHYFTNAEEDAGRMGLLSFFAAIIGSVLFAYILDKYRKYRFLLISTYFLTAVSMIIFVLALETREKALVYASVISFGFFSSANSVIGMRMGIELAYPIPEAATTLILMAPSQIVATVLAIVLGQVIESFGPFWSLCSQAIALTLGAILSVFIPLKLNRQKAFAKQNSPAEERLFSG